MNEPADPPIRDRFRIRFSKAGLLRWIGHRDLQRLWERMLRRADLRLSMSEGFHPKPRIGFPSALALGVEGLDEVVEIELAQTLTADEVRQKLEDDRQPGLAILSVRRVCRIGPGGNVIDGSETSAKAKLHSSRYEIELPQGIDSPRIDNAVDRAVSEGTVTVMRKGKAVTAQLAVAFPELRREGMCLRLTQVELPGTVLKPTELLDALGLGDLIESGAVIRRTEVRLVDEMNHRKHNSLSNDRGTPFDEERNADQCGAAGRKPHRDP